MKKVQFSLLFLVCQGVFASFFVFLNLSARSKHHREIGAGYLTSGIHWEMGWPSTALTIYPTDYWDGMSVILDRRKMHPLLMLNDYNIEWDRSGIVINIVVFVVSNLLFSYSIFIFRRRLRRGVKSTEAPQGLTAKDRDEKDEEKPQQSEELKRR